jgi:hypothetical protein
MKRLIKEAERRKAVAYMAKAGTRAAAAEYGVSESALKRWRRYGVHGDAYVGPGGRDRGGPDVPDVQQSALEDRIAAENSEWLGDSSPEPSAPRPTIDAREIAIAMTARRLGERHRRLADLYDNLVRELEGWAE